MKTNTCNLLIAFYGDDFTGSTDSMEALSLNGVKTILFLEPPAAEMLSRFPGIQGFGIAGISRSLNPVEMEAELTPIFQSMKQHACPVIHYKICSTFDSAPDVGSIGKAMDIGRRVFPESRYIPLLVGAPTLKRYTVFGQHYAGIDGETYRLDRHPTMSRHPVTPMDEADLLKHLKKQTDMQVELMSVLHLSGSQQEADAALEQKLAEHPDSVLYDVLDEEHLLKTGGLIWREAQRRPLFVTGSSGVEYALTAYWQQQGIIKAKSAALQPTGPAKQLFAISGSCSPVTKEQIEYALKEGFIGIRAPMEQLIDPAEAETSFNRLLQQAKAIFEQGKDLVIYSALGPEDESIDQVKTVLAAKGLSLSGSSRLLGKQMGKLTKELIKKTGIRRILVGGGDTSGYVTKELGIYGLETLTPIAPGGPLCKGYSEHPQFDGLELSLKGGQVGKKDYLIKVKNGC